MQTETTRAHQGTNEQANNASTGTHGRTDRDGDPLGVDSAEVRILKQPHQVRLGRLWSWKRHHHPSRKANANRPSNPLGRPIGTSGTLQCIGSQLCCSLAYLLQGEQGRRLEAQASLIVHGDFAREALEGELADEELG
jgi:hypothetical protein